MDSTICYLGVDLGGTQLRMAAVDARRAPASDVISTPTGRAFGPSDLQQGARRPEGAPRPDAQRTPRGRARLRHRGRRGRGAPAHAVENLPLLNGTDVASLVRDVAELPVRLENDARCFTLAEARFGAGRGARDVCGITLGTGVGCGVMVDGRLQHGANFQAGEVWRIPMRGAPPRALRVGRRDRAHVLRGGRRGPRPIWTRPGSSTRARAGDAAARAAWRVFSEDLAFLCETSSACSTRR